MSLQSLVRAHRSRSSYALALLLVGACHESESDIASSASSTADAGETPQDLPDAAPDAEEGEAKEAHAETVRVLALSTEGHDRLYGVTHDTMGNIYVVGQSAESTATDADFAIVLAKLDALGNLDSSFAEGGIAKQNVTVGGGSVEVARGVVVQSTGKIVVAGVAEHDPQAAGQLARDADIVLLRFNADGSLDGTFGREGVARFDLGTGVETQGMNGPTLSGGDAQWSLSLAANDGLVVHGATRAKGTKSDGTERTDTDWALLRLAADGARDSDFGEDGMVTLDIGEANGSARSATVLADGSIIGTGYATTTTLGESTQQPVLYKVTPAGAFDESFATEDATAATGVFYDYVTEPNLRAEAYAAAPQGTSLVTLGYGPTPGTGTSTDWVFCRFTGEGALDRTFGKNGIRYVDVEGYGDNGRAVVVLPDARILGIGGGRKAPEAPLAEGAVPPADAMIALLTEDGDLDPLYGEGGVKLFDFGGAGDFFWGGEVAPRGDTVAVVGIAGAKSEKDDDDAVLLLMKLD
ncbi:MAG: hypothetical protein RL385_175 [Pseudomonadota bacterium]|jgi:uncharacterized delta-60 repeat protein